MSDGIKLYGKTSVERLLDEKQQSREIIREILDFNVSERQLYQLIKLLAENLENYHHMRVITDIIDEMQQTDVGDLTGLKERALEQLAKATDVEDASGER